MSVQTSFVPSLQLCGGSRYLRSLSVFAYPGLSEDGCPNEICALECASRSLDAGQTPLNPKAHSYSHRLNSGEYMRINC